MQSSQTAPRVGRPFLIGVAGGTASGKLTVCQKIMAKLGQDCQRRVALIKQDSFYRELDDEELALARKGCFNFDHPDAVDEAAMYTALKNILDGNPVRLPIHDYQDNRPKPGEFYEVSSADVVLFEGVLIFYFPKVRDMFHMKLFVDTDSDIRLSRRVMRDVRERGRTLDIVLSHYDQYVKPAFEEFCQPTKKYADMIIPRGADNEVAIGLINHNITFLLTTGRAASDLKRAGTVYPSVSAPPLAASKQQSTSNAPKPSTPTQSVCPPVVGHRSRSNSNSNPATTSASQRFTSDNDISEEQDVSTGQP